MGGGCGATGRRDEVLLITGCSDGGIGASLALAFSDAGYSVVATSRSLDTMRQLQENPHIATLAIDITVEANIREAVETVMAKYGRIDILINNVGVPAVAPVAEAPLDSLVERTFQTNLFGPLLLIQAVVPHMAAQGKGVIANVGSIGTYAVGPWVGIYSSSKAALHSLSDALRPEKACRLNPFRDRGLTTSPLECALALQDILRDLRSAPREGNAACKAAIENAAAIPAIGDRS